MVEPLLLDRLASAFPSVPAEGLRASVSLLEEGAPIPFLARYRRERVGGLDEAGLRRVSEGLRAMREVESRRGAILRTLDSIGVLTDEARAAVEGAPDRLALEDHSAYWRPRRKGRGSAAREKGLEPLALRIASGSLGERTLAETASGFVSVERGVGAPEEALEGVRHLLVERVADDPGARALVRDEMRERGALAVVGYDAARAGAAKYRDYATDREPLGRVAPHRLLALRRAEREKVLHLAIEIDEAKMLSALAARFVGEISGEPGDFLRACVREAYEQFLLPGCAADVRLEAKESAEGEAIEVFARNLRHLLLAPPFGPRPVLGLEAASKGTWKAAIVDGDGRFLGDATLRVGEDASREAALESVRALLLAHGVEGIAVGSGPEAGRAFAFAREAARALPRRVAAAIVNSTGLASQAQGATSREEFPHLDAGVRAAIALARRLQDPLAELVKVDPRALGVGEYQHDVARARLGRALEETVESCVNLVGVDPNRAEVALLEKVAGLDRTRAEAIVARSKEKGPLRSRRELLEVPGIDETVFERCAGFLRIREGDEPLDATGVHPERYDLVRRMAERVGKAPADLIGAADLLATIPLDAVAAEGESLGVLRDVVHQLGLGGRDPRGPFRAAVFRDDVRSLEDLSEGMPLEGIVSNVTNFGAFVDLGLPQDGLVHVSELSDRFVRDPHEIVRLGQPVRVRVLAVDRERKRIALSMKTGVPRPARAAESAEARGPAEREVPRDEGTGAAREASRPQLAPPRDPRGRGRRERGEPAAAESRAGPEREGRERRGRGSRHDGRRREGGPAPLIRAATSRRDGLVRGERGGSDGRPRRGGRREEGGKPGEGWSGRREHRGFERGPRGESSVRSEPWRPFTHTPFKAFFDGIGASGGSGASEVAESAAESPVEARVPEGAGPPPAPPRPSDAEDAASPEVDPTEATPATD